VPWAVVLYEAPHRIDKTLSDLAQRLGAAREVVIGRELTKKFEEVARLALGEARAWLAGRPGRAQGEFVLVIAPGAARPAAALDAERVLDALLGEHSPSDAARLAARITGLPRAALYKKALERAK